MGSNVVPPRTPVRILPLQPIWRGLVVNTVFCRAFAPAHGRDGKDADDRLNRALTQFVCASGLFGAGRVRLY